MTGNLSELQVGDVTFSVGSSGGGAAGEVIKEVVRLPFTDTDSTYSGFILLVFDGPKRVCYLETPYVHSTGLAFIDQKYLGSSRFSIYDGSCAINGNTTSISRTFTGMSIVSKTDLSGAVVCLEGFSYGSTWKPTVTSITFYVPY